MNYGFVLPYGDARTTADLARLAELSGWDGFFVWDPVWGIDPWVALAAAAMLTERIRLGTMITPPSRRRPGLSPGKRQRWITSPPGGLSWRSGWAPWTPASRLSEKSPTAKSGLSCWTRAWKSSPGCGAASRFTTKGSTTASSRPNSTRHRRPSSSRASRSGWWLPGLTRNPCCAPARYDGLLPSIKKPDGSFAELTPPDIRAMKAYILDARLRLGIAPDAPYDIVHEGRTPGDNPLAAAEQLRPWAEAGVTWWIELMWGVDDPEAVRKRIEQGPPGKA